MSDSQLAPSASGTPERTDPLERAAHLARCLGTIESAFGLFGRLDIDPTFWRILRDDVRAEIEDLILEAHKERIGFADEARGEVEQGQDGRWKLSLVRGYNVHGVLHFDEEREAQLILDEIKETGEFP